MPSASNPCLQTFMYGERLSIMPVEAKASLIRSSKRWWRNIRSGLACLTQWCQVSLRSRLGLMCESGSSPDRPNAAQPDTDLRVHRQLAPRPVQVSGQPLAGRARGTNTEVHSA